MSESDWGALPFVILLLYCQIFGVLGSWVASQKRRSRVEGFWLGFLLGVVGVIIEGLLPNKGD